MGKPFLFTGNPRKRKRTLGSKTFQYQEEKRLISIPSVAASESGEAQICYGSNVGTEVVRHKRCVLRKESYKIIR